MTEQPILQPKAKARKIDEFSGYQAISNVVKLLENDAAQQRDAELPQHLIRCANG